MNTSFFSDKNIFGFERNTETSTQKQNDTWRNNKSEDYYHNTNKYVNPYKKNNGERTFKKLATDRGKIVIFIDGSNLFYTAGMMNLEIDYIKLVETLVEPKQTDEKLLRVYFYTGIDASSDNHVNWLYFMRRTGFKMVTKNLVVYPDGTKKANCDVEMAVDMVSLVGSYDTAILVTGDGDLTRAVEHLVNNGIQVHVCGHRSNTNEQLIKSADRFIDLETIKNKISLRGPNGTYSNLEVSYPTTNNIDKNE